MRRDVRFYLWLAGVNLFLSAFTFGGGYVVVPMVRTYFVEGKKLLKEEELLEMAAVAQSTPGAIAVNLVALCGWRTGGVPGLLVSCVSAVLPPLLILGVISAFYQVFIANAAIAAVLRGMQAAAAALIVDFLVSMAGAIRKERQKLLLPLAAAAFALSFFTRVNVIFVLLGSAAVCAGAALLGRGGE